MSEVYSVPDVVLSTLCVSSHLNGFNTLVDSYSCSPYVIERAGKVEKCAVICIKSHPGISGGAGI